jgi:hypothetical protein
MSRTGTPTHEDAQLILRLYELRREEKMRAARVWFNATFFPESIEQIREILNARSEENAYFRMVLSYWDMAASFVEYGAMNGELFLESSGEMLLVWAKIEPFVPQIRQDFDMTSYLINIERVVSRSQWAQERIQWYRKRIEEAKKRIKGPKEPSTPDAVESTP